MDEPETSNPHSLRPQEQQQEGQGALRESAGSEFSTAQGIGCLWPLPPSLLVCPS